MLTTAAVKPKLPLSLNGLCLFAYLGPCPCGWDPLALPQQRRRTRVSSKAMNLGSWGRAVTSQLCDPRGPLSPLALAPRSSRRLGVVPDSEILGFRGNLLYREHAANAERDGGTPSAGVWCRGRRPPPVHPRTPSLGGEVPGTHFGPAGSQARMRSVRSLRQVLATRGCASPPPRCEQQSELPREGPASGGFTVTQRPPVRRISGPTGGKKHPRLVRALVLAFFQQERAVNK